jgi:hypothetical protein
MGVTIRVHVEELAVRGLGSLDADGVRTAIAQALAEAGSGVPRPRAVGRLPVAVDAEGRPAEAVVAEAVRRALME